VPAVTDAFLQRSTLVKSLKLWASLEIRDNHR